MNLDCKKCSDGQKLWYGCEKPSTMGEWWQVGPFTLDRCPLKLVSVGTNAYIFAFGRYKKNILPEDGGWNNQPAKFCDIMEIIEQETAGINRTMEKKRHDKQRASNPAKFKR